MTLPVAILAGGLATRLGPLAERIPKALLDEEVLAGEELALRLRLVEERAIRDEK